MSYTRTQGRQELLRRWPWLGWAATADLVNAAYIQDVSEFKHERYGPNEFSQRLIYRPALNDNDRVREALTLDTTNGRLAQDGGSYSNTTELAYELLGMHPDEINQAFVQGQRNQVDRAIRALGAFTDSDMERSDVNYWDGTSGSSAKSNCTVAKSTSDGFSGTRALVITASGASAYSRGAKIRNPSSRKGWVGFILRADVGTITPKVYDFTNSAYLSVQSRAYSGEEFAFVSMTFQPLATTEEIQIEFGLTGASDVGVVDSVFGPHFAGRRLFNLPSELAEQYSVRYARPSVFQSQLSAGIFDVYSKKDIGDYVNGEDFRIETFPRAINPYRVNFDQSIDEDLLDGPVWLVAERPLSDVEPLDTESATTTADLDAFVAHAQAVLAVMLRDRNQDQKERFDQLVAETRIEAAIERLARPAPKRQQKMTVTRLRA